MTHNPALKDLGPAMTQYYELAFLSEPDRELKGMVLYHLFRDLRLSRHFFEIINGAPQNTPFARYLRSDEWQQELDAHFNARQAHLVRWYSKAKRIVWNETFPTK
jgi:hypothetical protein